MCMRVHQVPSTTQRNVTVRKRVAQCNIERYHYRVFGVVDGNENECDAIRVPLGILQLGGCFLIKEVDVQAWINVPLAPPDKSIINEI